MEFFSMDAEQQFRQALKKIPIQLPPPPNDLHWRDFFLSLYSQVIRHEQSLKRQYKDKVWDFCVIHSNHPDDCEVAQQFKRLLETSLGFFGHTLGDIALGENNLQAASTMVQGSSKVFFLVSEHFNDGSVPSFVFQESLMQQLQRPEWHCKLIPMYSSRLAQTRPPMFMANIQGFRLDDDTRTVDLVSGAISLDEQMQVRNQRRTDRARLENGIKRQMQRSFQEIVEVISRLRAVHGDDYDPDEQLQMTLGLLSLNNLNTSNAAMGRQSGQSVSLSSCERINIGPQFHFHPEQRDSLPCDDASLATTSTYFDPAAEYSQC